MSIFSFVNYPTFSFSLSDGAFKANIMGYTLDISRLVSEGINIFLSIMIEQCRMTHLCHHQVANDRKLVDMGFYVCLSRSFSNSLSSREDFVYELVLLKEDASTSV
jgi:hypothetical protein